MDFGEFQNVLLGLLSEEDFQKSSSIIENLIKENYMLYIELLLTAIPRFDNVRVFNVSITLLQIEVIKKRIFISSDHVIKIIEFLLPLISNILQSPKIQDNFKKIMIFVLAQLHIFAFHSSNNTSILEYSLKTFNKIPKIRNYITYCMFEISINDKNLGGFNFEDLLKILTDTAQDESFYISKVNLFFAIAMRYPNNETLQNIFPDLFLSCPKNNLDEMLLSLSDFSEQSSIFFLPYLGELVERLCNLASDTKNSESVRDKAMICLTSLAKGAPEMCQNTEGFYVPVFKTLLQIVSEINDKSPWKYDLNNTEPYQIALDSIASLFEKFDNPNIVTSIYKSVIEVLSEDETPWQKAYAYISALADANIIAMSNLGSDMIQDLYEKVSVFVDMQCHPRVRIAVYNFIYKLSLHGILHISKLSSILIEPLESNIISEDNPIAKKLAYEAYIEYISQPSYIKDSQYFERFFPKLIEELQSAPEDLQIYILRLIGPLFKSGRDDAYNSYGTVFNLLIKTLKSPNPNIKAECVNCVSQIISYLPRIPKLIALCNKFGLIGFSLLQNNRLEDESLDHLYKGINKLFIFTRQIDHQTVLEYLPQILRNCSKDLNIEETASFESNEIFKNTSQYLRISQIGDSSIKRYVSLDEIKTINNNLLILETFVMSDINFTNYLNSIYFVVNKWLAYELHIEPIQSKCLRILKSILYIYEDEYNTTFESKNFYTEIIEFVFNCYIINVKQKGSPLYSMDLLQVVNISLSFAKKLKWFNSDLFKKIIQTIQPFIDDSLAMKESKIKNISEFGESDTMDTFICHIDSCLSHISSIIDYCFQIQPDITNEFYLNSISPKIDQYLSNDKTLIFGISLLSSFIISNRDMTKMIEFSTLLMKYAHMFDRTDDLIIDSFYILGELLIKLPLKRKTDADKFMDFFVQYFQLDSLCREEMNLISDYANIAFAKFLISNSHFFEPVAATNAFLDAMPVWDSVRDSDFHFQCMADMMEKNWFQMACGDDWPEHTLGVILTASLQNMIEKPTEFRIARILADVYNKPDGKISIDRTLSWIESHKANHFFTLINQF